MTRTRWSWLVLSWLFVALLFASGCAKPEPPKIKPIRADVQQLTDKGIKLEIEIEVTNPNPVPIVARKVSAKVKVGDVELDEVTVPTKVDIPAKSSQHMTVPLSVDWKDLTALAMTAATKETIDFTIDGKAEIGVKEIYVVVPFTTGGTITRAQLQEAAGKALPTIPGLPLPSGLPNLHF